MNKPTLITALAIAIAVINIPAHAGMANLKVLELKATSPSALVHKTGGRRHGKGSRYKHHRGYRPKRNYGGAVAAGIALGAIGALAATRYSRPYYPERYYGPPRYRRSYYYESAFARRCRRWHHRCLDGSDRACWKFDRRC